MIAREAQNASDSDILGYLYKGYRRVIHKF